MSKKLSVLTINICAAILTITSIPFIPSDVAQARNNQTKKNQTKKNQTKKNQTKKNQTKKNQTKKNQTKKNQTKKNQTKKNQTKKNSNPSTPNPSTPKPSTPNPNNQQETIDNLLDITTSGIWTSVEVENDNQNAVSGLGTNEISWGNETQQSSYVFEGEDTSIGLDGGNYLLGTFTHNNFPITGDTITEANLALDLDVGGSSETFDLTFQHDETPNTAGPNGNGYVDDVVLMPNVNSKDLLEIDGEMYQLVVSGFYEDGHLTNEFMTKENKSNSAKIYGRLRRVPEPAAGLGLLAIGAFGTFKLKKKIN